MKLPILIAALFGLIAGCGEESPTTQGVPVLQTSESDHLALWVSGELTAPAELSLQIARDLHRIRTEFGTIYPPVHHRFVSQWGGYDSGISITFDASTWNAFRGGSYHAWDELFGRFGTPRIQVLETVKELFLYFDERYHPQRLADLFRALPGVVRCGALGLLGDYSNVYASVLREPRRYLFMEGSGDCPAGCTKRHFVYFRFVGDHLTFVGSYDGFQRPPPAWWPEAEPLRRAYGNRMPPP